MLFAVVDEGYGAAVAARAADVEQVGGVAVAVAESEAIPVGRYIGAERYGVALLA